MVKQQQMIHQLEAAEIYLAKAWHHVTKAMNYAPIRENKIYAIAKAIEKIHTRLINITHE